MPARGIVAALLALLVVAVYAPVRDHEFLNYDDRVYVLESPLLAEGLSAAGVRRAFGSTYHDGWIPLTWLSLMANHALHGPRAGGYLLTNVALHAASAVGLFLLLAGATGALGASAFVAAVFAAHPLHVESVAWVSERKDALSGFLFVCLLAAHLWHARRPGGLRLAAVAVVFSLGLMAKPMLVTAPCVLLLLDFWPLGRLADPGGRRRALLEKLPLLLLSAAAAALTFAVQRQARATLFGSELPLAIRVANALESYVTYLAQSVWPSGLAAFYPYAPLELSAPRAAAWALLLLLLSAGAWWARRRQPALLVGWLWYLGMLVPVIGLVQVGLQARADRYTYLPQIGLSLALAFGALGLARRLRIPPRVLGTAALGVVLALGVAARRQVGTWRDTRTLFERAARVTERNFYAENALGGVHLEAGRRALAERHYRRAIAFEPGWAPPHLGLAYARLRAGDPQAALRHYRDGLALDPEHAGGHAQLGALLLQQGRRREALAHLLRARELGEDGPELQRALRAARRAAGGP